MDKVYNTWSLLWIVLTFILNQMKKHKTFYEDGDMCVASSSLCVD